MNRCATCRIDQRFCICAHRISLNSECGFLILYYDDEVLKPSNTGRLIADLIPETHAFIWQRTQVEPGVLAVLEDPQWQPFVLFPEAYCDEGREMVSSVSALNQDKKPLFVLLDGSWREARKMFRNSPYLDQLPVLSFSPERLSDYFVRKAAKSFQLATAEVAALALECAGEALNGQKLAAWFDVFSFQYQQGVLKPNQGDPQALEKWHQIAGLNTDRAAS